MFVRIFDRYAPHAPAFFGAVILQLLQALGIPLNYGVIVWMRMGVIKDPLTYRTPCNWR